MVSGSARESSSFRCRPKICICRHVLSCIISRAYSPLDKEHQALLAKHQDMFFNSTPSAIVQDLQQQADDLTAETDRRCKAYGQLKKERRSVSNQVQELRTQNTHLMQVTMLSCHSLTNIISLCTRQTLGRKSGELVAMLCSMGNSLARPDYYCNAPDACQA